MLEHVVAVVLMWVVFSCVLHTKEIRKFWNLPAELLRTYYFFLDERKFVNKYFKGPFIRRYFSLRGWSLSL